MYGAYKFAEPKFAFGPLTPASAGNVPVTLRIIEEEHLMTQSTLSSKPFAEETAVTIAVAGVTTILDVILRGDSYVVILEVENVGATNAFDAFVIQLKATEASQFADFIASWTVSGDVRMAAPDPATLATTSKSTVAFNIPRPYAMRIQASANTNTTTAKVRGNAYG